MRQIVIASHAHFATGILESIELLAGKQDNVRAVPFFVDGNDDVAAMAEKIVADVPAGDDLVVATDILGGSVNNEFLKAMQTHDNVYLATNTNLPFLLQLVLASEESSTADILREFVGSDDTCVKFMNDVLAASDTEGDEEF